MSNEILKVYNKLIFSYNKVSYIESNRLLKELYLLSLSLYIKNILKDKRTLNEIKEILQEELKETIY